ncbi:M50 family metallopeptidase [Lachnotalea glycerini]|uniref:Peptide zinc metalloprotease protein n=1 Tax=Lachnotalea glycerini TaxID=1763509 RepID=A0A371JGR9_9FIRM|nr:M50 family metallopeptidase [Lachnotalea glycerini]RDY31929.1 hypothetical protein CG710_007230 [Lachnotalea glycerini]
MSSYIVDDIIITDDKFCGKYKYFMISESRGKYIKLRKSQYEFYKNLIPCFLETTDIEKLESAVQKYSQGKISLENISQTFQKHNLLRESVEERKGTVEVEFSSIKVCEIPLTQFQKEHKKLLRIMWNMMCLISALSIVGCVVLLFLRHNGLLGMIESTQNNSWRDILNMNIPLLLLGMFWCIAGHEIGHLLTADHYEMEWKNINFALRWGISLVYYVKYKNFYAHPSKVKLKIILAGTAMNMIQACVYFSLYLIFPSVESVVLLTINLLSTLNNILPKGTSDGYHAFCILAGLEGIRWKMLKLISEIIKYPSNFIKLFRNRENILLLLYFGCSYFISLFSCYKLLISSNNYLSVLNEDVIRNVCIWGFTIYVCFGVCYSLNKLIRNLKGM